MASTRSKAETKPTDDKGNVTHSGLATFGLLKERHKLLVSGLAREIEAILDKEHTESDQKYIPSEIISLIDLFYYDKHDLNAFLKVGDQIDGRDFTGKWYIAEVKKYKKANEPIPEKPELSARQQKNRDKLEKLGGFHLHFLEWEEKWDEWIFIGFDGAICTCSGECKTYRKAANVHRLALPNTQSEIQRKKKW